MVSVLLSKVMDQGWFVPGRCSQVVICPFVVRQGESPGTTRGRMSNMVEKVQDAHVQTEQLPPKSSLWASFSRPRSQRLTASHASKIRKLLWTLQVNAKAADCEYSTGTVWYGELSLAVPAASRVPASPKNPNSCTWREAGSSGGCRQRGYGCPAQSEGGVEGLRRQLTMRDEGTS